MRPRLLSHDISRVDHSTPGCISDQGTLCDDIVYGLDDAAVLGHQNAGCIQVPESEIRFSYSIQVHMAIF